jgi:hypothetical protein
VAMPAAANPVELARKLRRDVLEFIPFSFSCF